MISNDEAQKQYDVIAYDDKNVFIPTDAQRKLLAVFPNPDYVGLNIKQKCEVAGVHVNTYMRAMKDIRFKKALKYLMLETLKDNGTSMEVITAMKNFATTDARCFQDRKLLLQLLDVYVDKKELNINKKSMNVDVSMSKATTEEIQAMVKQMLRDDPTLLDEPIEVQDEFTGLEDIDDE